MKCRSFILPALVLACTAAVWSQESRLMSFEMEDQFGQIHTDEEYRGQVMVVTASDRGGSKGTVEWGRAMIQALDPTLNLLSVRYVAVANLKSVPSVARKKVRKKFPQDELQWTLLDWKGQWAKTYGFESKATNILVFDASGALLFHAHGQQPDARQAQGIADAIKTAVEQADTIVLGGREQTSHRYGWEMDASMH